MKISTSLGLAFYMKYTYTYEGDSESITSYVTTMAHDVRGRCWW